MNAGEEVLSGFVVAGCDGTELLEFCKEVLDQVPFFVDVAVIGPSKLAICFREPLIHLLLTVRIVPFTTKTD